jgi:hypothetical protein
MSDETKMRPFAAAEAGARQLIMMAGLGFLGLVVGALLTEKLYSRFADRIDGEPSAITLFIFAWIIPNLWAFVVMPGFAWISQRFLDLNALTFAVVSCGTAFVFRSLMAFVSGGAELVLGDTERLFTSAIVLGVGVALTWVAGRRGQSYARAQAAVAAQQAQKTKEQYSQFAEQAKALAERRDAQPISAAAPGEVTASALQAPATEAAAVAVQAPATDAAAVALQAPATDLVTAAPAVDPPPVDPTAKS